MSPGLALTLIAALVCALGGVPSILLSRRRTLGERGAAAIAVAGSAIGVTGALLALWHGPDEAAMAWSLPGLRLTVGIDGLSALFLLPLFLVSGLAAVYGCGYAPALGAKGRALPACQGTMTAAMVVLLLARNGMLFLVGFEVMALSAFLMIATEHQHRTTARAAWVYLVSTHLCTLILVAAMLLLQGPDGSLDWHQEGFAALAKARRDTAFALAAVAFGLKAGLMPLHVWLPGAHGSAPSHVSAVLSGVLLKMGVYGVLRLAVLMPGLPAAFGVVLLVVGAASALLGIAATLAQGDLKRLLAYSSIENLGIVFVGLGMFLIGRADGDTRLATLGLGGALFHVLNHALCKPLLFLCAGSFVHATGTRELDRLGGLWRRMPRTAACFTVGGAAIGGLPPLNGFAGELALLLGLFTAAMGADAELALLAAAAIGALAMVSGLATATFVRTIGAVCLGRPRTDAAAHAHESPASMTTPLLLLATACIAIGFAPWAVVPVLDAAIAACGITGAASLGALVPYGALSTIVLLCAGVAAGLLAWLVARARRDGPPAVGTWDCGYVDAASPRLQYTAAGSAQFGVRILGWTARERHRLTGEPALYPRPRTFVRKTLEPLLRGVLWPLAHRLADACQRIRFLQRGNLQMYLLYILVGLVALLTWSAAHPTVR